MLECLQNLVGYNNRCPSDEFMESINQLEGMQLSMIDKITSDEYKSAVDLINTKIALSIKQIETDVIIALREKMEIDTTVYNGRAGWIQTPLVLDPALPIYKGIYVNEYNMENQSIFIDSLSLITDYTGNVEVKLFNCLTGQQIDSAIVPCVAGVQASKQVNWVLTPTNHNIYYFIGYDATLVDAYQTQGYDRGMYSQTIALDVPIIYDNFRNSSLGSGGLGLIYSISCSLHPFICSNKPFLKMPLLYLCALNIVKEALVTRRLSSVGLTHKEQLKIMEVEFEGKYKQYMNAFVQGCKIPVDRCFKCNTRTHYKQVIP
jgi:hypothetical protein